MSKSKTRIKTDAVEAPETREQAERLLADIGSLQRKVTDIETAMNTELSGIKARYERQAQPHNEAIAGKFRALHLWAEANRGVLLNGRAKTARLATGELSWRTTPPSVRVTGVDLVLATLKKLGFHDLIRKKEEVNKEAVLADPARVEGVKGITISQREEFVAKPFESEIERAEPVLKQAA